MNAHTCLHTHMHTHSTTLSWIEDSLFIDSSFNLIALNWNGLTQSKAKLMTVKMELKDETEKGTVSKVLAIVCSGEVV